VSKPAAPAYEFGEFRLATFQRVLFWKDELVPITPKAFDTLLALVRRHGEVVDRDELMQIVWPDTFVELNSLARNISVLRRLLGDDANGTTHIETIPKRGYCFVAPVHARYDNEAAGSPQHDLHSTRALGNGVADDEAGPFAWSANRIGPTALEDGINGALLDTVPGTDYRLPAAPHTIAHDLPALRHEGTPPPDVLRRLAGSRLKALAATLCVVIVASSAWLLLRQRPQLPAPAAQARAVVALPFRTLSGNDDEYVAEGIGEAVTTALSNLQGLVVISRNSAAKYKGRVVDPREIGKALGVTHVLDGTVQRSGPRLRVTAQLADATTGLQVWGAQYDRERAETFALQDAIAASISRALRPDLPTAPPRSAPTAHLGAYDEYLRGRHEFHADRILNAPAAIARFERATALDPQFGLAHAALATAYASRFFYRDTDRELQQKAFVAIEKALAIDPNLAEAHLARANLLWTLPNGFPHEQAVAEYRRAIGLNPNLGDARSALARVLMHLGFQDEAIAELRIAVQLDPSDKEAAGRISHCYYYSHQHEQVLAELEHLGSDSWFKANSLMHLGRVAEALQVARADLARATQAKNHIETLHRSTYALMLARSGDRAGAQRELALLEPRLANVERYSHLHHAQYNAACALALLGRKREALHWLQTAADEGFPCYPFYKGEPSLAGLGGDPAFDAFLAQLENRWQQHRATLFGP
jgi:TolB-like protein/DNA-binding winged helix-turn-helix (wHTH) protein